VSGAGGIHTGDQCDADRSIGRLVTATNAHTATTISTSTPSTVTPPNAHIQPPALPYRIIAPHLGPARRAGGAPDRQSDRRALPVRRW